MYLQRYYTKNSNIILNLNKKQILNSMFQILEKQLQNSDKNNIFKYKTYNLNDFVRI